MGYLITSTHLNLVFVWRICILIVYITTSAAGRQNANLFSKMGNARDRTGFAQEHPSKSAIHCATSCQEKSECQTFSFDKKTKTCKLGNASTESTRMYKKQGNMIGCSEGKGYILWVYPEKGYCLKYNTSESLQPAAKQTCEDDGGNLVLLDSKLIRLRLHTISVELVEPTTVGYIWIDGFDIGSNNKFISWKGNELPGSEWAPDQPQNRENEDCMDSRWDQFFQLRDSDCYSWTEPFFCEIEFT